MSTPGLFQLKANIQTERLRLLPDGPLNLGLPLCFSADGVLDFEDLVDRFIEGLESHMGKLKSIGQADRDSLKAQLAPCLIEQAIHAIPDVLDDFEDDGAPQWDSAGLLHLPLAMKGSGRKLDLVIKESAEGSDLEALVDDIEESYRSVMSEAINQGYADGNILSGGQREGIKSGAPSFLSAKGHEAALRLLAAVEFELLPDNECWLRGGGVISMRLVIKVDQLDYSGPPRQIKVHSTNNAFYDPKAIAEQLAQILSEYLQGKVALSQFSGAIKAGMMKKWGEDAKQWLIDNIRSDLALFDYIQFRAEKGSELVMENAFARQPIKVDIKFQDGQCYFGLMVFSFSEKAGKIFDVDELFTSKQKAAMEKAMAPVMVKAMRDKGYCHPYSQDTKTKLLGMAEYIKIAAKNLDVSALALAGAVADALDDNLEARMQKGYELWRRYLLEAVQIHSQKLAEFVSLLITFAGKSADPRVYVTAGAIDLLWKTMSAEAQNEVLAFLASFLNSALIYLGKEIAEAVAGSRDEHSDTLVILQVLKEIDASKISEKARTKLLNELDQKLKSIMNPSQVLCFYLVGGSKHSGRIVKNAKMIKRALEDCNKDPKERLYVTKWERFYHYFS